MVAGFAGKGERATPTVRLLSNAVSKYAFPRSWMVTRGGMRTMRVRGSVSVALLAAVVGGSCLALAAPATATAAVQTQEVQYQQGDTPLQGFLAWNDADSTKRPGVLVVHEWWGENENT